MEMYLEQEAIRNVDLIINHKRIDHYGFYNMSYVSRIFISDSVRFIGMGAFTNVKAFQLELGEGVEVIRNHAFALTSIEEVVIPPRVKNIGTQAFAFIKGLEYVEFRGVKPPKMSENVFDGYDGVIYVPRGSLLAYKRVLGDFNIKEKNDETKQDFYRVG